MLDKRPYEPKEIKPVTITTHDTYTSFDCRKVPYPDRHYADPEAGCSVSFNIRLKCALVHDRELIGISSKSMGNI